MTVRPAQPDDIPAIARVHVDSWRTTYAGIVDAAHLAALSYPEHEARHRKYIVHPGTFYRVAEVSDEGLVGFATGGAERSGNKQFSGELYAIYLLAQHQRRGLGRALVQAWAMQLRGLGMNSALVWVLAENVPGVRFYERLGARNVGEQMIEIAGKALKEISYGWEDLGALCDSRDVLAD